MSFERFHENIEFAEGFRELGRVDLFFVDEEHDLLEVSVTRVRFSLSIQSKSAKC